MAVSFCLSVEAGSRENCSSDCHRWIRLEPLPPTTVSRAKGEREPDGCLRNLHAKEEFATPFCSPPSTLPPLSLFILLLSLDKKLLPWFDEIRCIILFIWNSLLLYLTKSDVLNYLLETRGGLLLICGQLKMINLDNLWLLWMIIYYLLYILLLLPPLSFSNLFISLSSLSEKG